MIYRFVMAPSIYDIIGRPMMNHATKETAVRVAQQALSTVYEPLVKREDGDAVAFYNEEGGELMRVIPVPR